MNDKNDQRALLAITLSLVVFTAWSFFFGPKPKPPEEQEAVPAEATASAEAPAPADPAAPAPTAATDSGPCVSEPRPLTTSIAALAVDNCGRAVSSVQVVGKSAPVAVTPWWTWIWLTVTGKGPGSWTAYGEDAGPLTLVKDGSFAAAGRGTLTSGGTWQVTEAGGGVTMRRTTTDGMTVTTTLTPQADGDVFDVVVRWEATQPLLGPLWIGVDEKLADIKSQYDTHVHLSAFVDDDLEPLTKPSEITAPKGLEGPVSWFGLSDRYFLAALVPDDPTWGQLVWAPTADGRVGAFLVSSATNLEPGKPVEAKLRAYVGPKDAERLAQVGGGLEGAAALGFFGFFGKLFLFLLHVFQKGLVNWALSIMALTVLVRAALWPMMRSSFISSKKMQVLAPLMREVQEKYKDDQAELQRQMMKVYQDTGTSPLGCMTSILPMFFQIPIFFGLLAALQSTPDLFHADFLYVRDLSMPDPYGLLPGLMTIGMVVQQRLTPMTGMDPTQQQIMKLMPFMFAAFMFTAPAGLQVYYVINTALVLFQQWYNLRSWEQQQAAATA